MASGFLYKEPVQQVHQCTQTAVLPNAIRFFLLLFEHGFVIMSFRYLPTIRMYIYGSFVSCFVEMRQSSRFEVGTEKGRK